ncbi:hypothetical protein EGW08_008051 [Elysia chlorotica]|uniref:RING-type E3 ubiquitin transferase n=1 Tax=Elysia chlorotica TaxID=188477 RepID=A0A433TRH8_ELYCH|nr:hypothetical protein EGW08_008051 [Elysia chlorotica]
MNIEAKMSEIPPKLAEKSTKEVKEGESGHDTDPAYTANLKLYKQALKSIEDMSLYLRPLLEGGSDDENTLNSTEDHQSSPNKDTSSDKQTLDKSNKIAPTSDIIQDADDQASENVGSGTNTEKSAGSRSSEYKSTSVQTFNKRNTMRTNSPGYKHGANGLSHHDGQQQQKCVLSRPMQRKLFSLLQCQLLEEEGQARSARIARSLGERVVTELLVLQQFPHQLSSNLWAAVRTRGCQFLGPAMQEEVLKLILLALEDGSPLSRKVLVLFVVQKLEVRYSQASKTAIGHVVQLLYRASCFKVQKREGESSLMQLKEEFRQYEALRREHDSQIVQIALEAGLRISPEQWSSLLYGDVAHKPHMQSIIDKHQSPQSFSQNIAELMGMFQKNPKTINMLRLKPHLEFLSNIDPSPDSPVLSWENLEAVMRSVSTIVSAFVEYLTLNAGEHSQGAGGVSGVAPDASLAHNTRYKTSMCRDYTSRGTCPRGPTCTFAHTQEEMEKYRLRSRKNGVRGRLPTQEKTTSSLTQSESDQLRQVQLLSKLKDEMPVQACGTSVQITLPAGDKTVDTTHFLSVSSPVKTSIPVDSHSVSSSIGGMKFSPGDLDKRSNINTSTTRLTFSTPALDGQEPSNTSAKNQQASLHPNNPHAKPFFPAQQLPMAPPSVLPQANHMVNAARAAMAACSVQPRDTGGGIGDNPQQQQGYSSARVGVVSSASQHPYLLSTDPRLAYPGAPNEDGQMSHVVLDQFMQQQMQGGMLSSGPVMPFPVQQRAQDSASLGDLWQRKKDIIRHLREDPTFLSWQDPTLYTADNHRAGFLGLESVLSLNKLHTRDSMPKPVSDSFVATRSMQSLDKLAHEESLPSALQQSQHYRARETSHPNSVSVSRVGQSPQLPPFGTKGFPPASATSHVVDTHYTSSSGDEWLRRARPPWQSECSAGDTNGSNSYNVGNGHARGDNQYNNGHLGLSSAATSSSSSGPVNNGMYTSYSASSSGDYQGQQMSMHNSLARGGNGLTPITCSSADSEFSHFPADDDENFIPFELTKVSKFGPISRLNKARSDYNAAVQVTADVSCYNSLTRPSYSNAPSSYGPNTQCGFTSISSSASVCYTTGLPRSASHSRPVERLVGEPAVKPTALENRSIWEQSPLPSYQNIAQLMVGAASAVSNNEKLAYQLQAVELEISLKTGRKPEPVIKMVQAAVGPGLEGKGMMDVIGAGSVTACLRDMELGSVSKADERFADWNGVSK